MIGACSIKRGRSGSARLAGRIAGMPPAADESQLSVRIEAHSWGELWIRHFGAQRMQSRLTVRRGLLVEKLGPLTMFFELRAEGTALYWTPRAGRVLGVPLPIRFFAGVTAVESVCDDRYCFNVRASLPWIGLIVHYQGWLRSNP